MKIKEYIAQLMGTAHVQQEDVVYTIQIPGFRFFGIADGQSRKKHCREGALASLKAVVEVFRKINLSSLTAADVNALRASLWERISIKLDHFSEAFGCEKTELASTLVCVAMNEHGDGVILHLGDGRVCTRRGSELVTVSGPDNGMTKNATYLTTSANGFDHLRISIFKSGELKNFNGFMLMSDGAESTYMKLVFIGDDSPWDSGFLRKQLELDEPYDDATIVYLQFEPEVTDCLQ